MARPKIKGTLPKIGMTEKIAADKGAFLSNFYARRRILTVPQEILDANPDKHFCYLSMNKIQKSGMWHEEGYQLYNLKNDKENMNNTKFMNPIDSYIHRNEMVLGWIPKEEFELRQLEFDVARGKKDLTSIISKNPNLAGFSAHAKETKEVMSYPEPNLEGGSHA